jgi:hypothetical protein
MLELESFFIGQLNIDWSFTWHVPIQHPPNTFGQIYGMISFGPLFAGSCTKAMRRVGQL